MVKTPATRLKIPRSAAKATAQQINIKKIIMSPSLGSSAAESVTETMDILPIALLLFLLCPE